MMDEQLMVRMEKELEERSELYEAGYKHGKRWAAENIFEEFDKPCLHHTGFIKYECDECYKIIKEQLCNERTDEH